MANINIIDSVASINDNTNNIADINNITDISNVSFIILINIIDN